MSEGLFSISKLEERDFALARDVFNEGFAEVFRAFFGEIPTGRPEGERVRSRFHRPKTVSVGLWDDHHVLQGVMLFQVAGTRGMCGPLALRPAYDTRIAAPALVTAAVVGGMKLGCTTIDSVTFPQSVTHFMNHFTVAEPLFPNPYLVKDVTSKSRSGRGNTNVQMVPLSSLDEAARAARILEMASITSEFSPGFDLGIDAIHVIEQKLGETVLAMLDGRVVGFAICHIDPSSEAFREDELLIKHAYIKGRDAAAAETFTALLHHLEDLARGTGKRGVGLMASSGRRSMLRLLLDRDYVVEELHQHWACRCAASEGPKSLGDDSASIQSTHFGTSELR